jgi:Cft2 family RNA processing exonuclease
VSHIFISYANDDTDSAALLKRELTDVGFEVWMDADKLRTGKQWRDEIDAAIRSAAAMIVVMTPAARDSEYVAYEWAFAWGAGIKLIPLLRKPTALHPRLESLQYLDFTQDQDWKRLVEVLKEAQDSEPAPQAVQEINIADEQEQKIYQRMIEALKDINWTWRSIHTLAGKAGVSEERALEILRRDENVRLGWGKSGRRIAKLKSR